MPEWRTDRKKSLRCLRKLLKPVDTTEIGGQEYRIPALNPGSDVRRTSPIDGASPCPLHPPPLPLPAARCPHPEPTFQKSRPAGFGRLRRWVCHSFSFEMEMSMRAPLSGTAEENSRTQISSWIRQNCRSLLEIIKSFEVMRSDRMIGVNRGQATRDVQGRLHGSGFLVNLSR